MIPATSVFLTFVVNYLNQCPLSNPVGYTSKCCGSHRTYDFIIVGGGSAGSTLAARLSERHDWNILLIEAGGVPSNLSEVPGMFLGLQGTYEDWQFKTQPGNYSLSIIDGRSIWPQGKALGGGSTINAMLAVRGDPHNFKEWSEMGNTRWGWDDIKPYFDKAFDHMNTTRYVSTMPTRSRIIEAAKFLGFQINTPDLKIGYEDVNLTINGHQRHNVAKAYLVPAHRRRNLCIMTHSQVEKVIFRNKEAIGVQLMGKKIYARKEVIISAGSINSPKLLMLSGVGPKEHLKEKKVRVVKDLEGIGKNLMDHMSCPFFIKLPKLPIEVNIKELLEPYCKDKEDPLGEIDIAEAVGWINTDNITDYANIQYMHLTFTKNDQLQMPLLIGKAGYNPSIYDSLTEINKEATIIICSMILSRPKSRGEVLLASTKIEDHPLIYPRYLSHPDDMKAMIGAVDHMKRLIDTPVFKEVGAEVTNFDIPNCRDLEFNTHPYWECYIRNLGTTLYHPSGTSKMGRSDDDMAVVDEDCKIHGLENIRVVDASIMPKIVTGNTNMPVIAFAERIADVIKSSY